MKGCLGCLGTFVCLVVLITIIGTCSDEPAYKDNVSRSTQPSQQNTVVEPVLTRDEKRFFWATLNVDGVVIAPGSEIVWAAKFLTERNMSDSEFQRFMSKIGRYKNFVINHPDKVELPAWASGKF